jgi:zinc transport system ATP-binding protein
MTIDAAPATPLIAAAGLVVRFGDQVALDHVDIAVHRREIVTVVGPNGSGKTTLVRTLLGLLAASGGTVRRAAGLGIGYVPQHVHVDATLPITVRRFLTLGARADAARIGEALGEVGAARVADAPMHALSGGEMRRVLLARALLRRPDLLVLDEPTSGVDISGQAELYGLIKAIRDRRGCGVLLVSHNLHLVMAATDRVVCLNQHVCCEGHPEAVTRNPAYLTLFGPEASAALAVYSHRHDHRHDISGAPVPDDSHDHDRGDRHDRAPRRAAER